MKLWTFFSGELLIILTMVMVMLMITVMLMMMIDDDDVDDYSYVDTYDINPRDRNAEEKKEEAKRLEEVG